MKTYELTYLVSPDILEEEAILLSTKINSFIEEKGGILKKNLPLLKKQLSYPIKKKNIAYLMSLTFQVKAESLKEIKKQIEINSNILRHLLFIKKEEESQKIIKNLIKKPKKIIKTKVDLKEIEKKIEEILE